MTKKQMILLKNIVLVTLAVLAWTTFIGYGFVEGFLLRSIASENTSEAFVEATKEKVGNEFVGNLAMILIDGGKVSKDYFFTTDLEVNGGTVFPLASISKWVTSFGVLKLVEQGRLDLDAPVDDYLTRWHLPKGEFDNRKVTVRRLLSHTSGLVDDLGYAGFAPDEQVQTIEESLNKAADGHYSEGVARVGYEPGSRYMYSGAGYTILQLMIEEVSGQSFQAYMDREVFVPLAMDNATFVLSEKPDLQFAQFFKDDGTIATPTKFTALAAASLYASTADLSKFLLANISKNTVLSQETIMQMSEPEAFIYDVGIHGLGPHLYSQHDKGSNIIGHDGSGNNALNTAARIDLKSKSGIIVLETGNHSIASAIADEWIFWKFGIADYVVMQRNKSYILTLLGIGYVVIIAFSIFIIRKK